MAFLHSKTKNKIVDVDVCHRRMQVKAFLLAITINLLALNYAYSQTPTRAQMQEQAQRLKREANEQIAEMEKEITEARKSNQDPESIREMEKNLATMKKMLGVVDKATNVSDRRPKVVDNVNTVARYKSPYLKFFTQPVVIPTKAQAKDKLLWYSGKKINRNTLVTTTGRVIQYNRQTSQVTVQYNERRDKNPIKIIKNIAKSRQWTADYVSRKAAEKNSFFDYPQVMLTMKTYELIEKRFDKFAKNSFELPNVSLTASTQPGSKFFSSLGGPTANFTRNATDSIDPYVKDMYEYIMSLVNNPPPLEVFPPPKQEYSLCYNCDASAMEQYERDLEIWSNGLHEYENSIISRCLSIYRYYALMISEDYESAMDPQMLSDLKNAEAFAMQRIEKKVEMLDQRYGDDMYRYSAVISEILGLERQKALLYGSNDIFDLSQFRIFATRAIEQFIHDRLAANDYDVVFNYSVILGFARQAALLGISDDDTYQNLIVEIVNSNRFTLTLDLDFDLQMGEDDKAILKANGTLSTKDKIYVKLGRKGDCKWQFYLFDADYSLMTQENDYKLPIIMKGGTKMVRKGNAWETFSYSGPTDLLMPFPSFRISFCQTSQQDSALIDILRYEQEDLSGYDPATSYTVDLLGYVNKMLVSVKRTKDNTDEVTNIADQMINLASHNISVTPTGYALLDKMQAEFNGNEMQHQLQKRVTETSKVDNTIVLFNAQSGTAYLINSNTNTANEEYSIDVKKGLITLKVVHEPL